MTTRYSFRLSQPDAADAAARGASWAVCGVPTPLWNRHGLQTMGGQTMGTQWHVRLANPQQLPLQPVQALVEQCLERVVQQMSHWRSDSDLCRFNRATAGTWQALEPEFFQVLQAALHWCEVSAGAFDPTMAPLVKLWGFGPHATAGVERQPPQDSEVIAARACVDGRRLMLRAEDRHVLQPGGMALDLSAIAKGFAVDLVTAQLAHAGWHDCLVEIGGELRASGTRPDGQPWRVAIAHGDRQVDSSATPDLPPLALRDQAVATSGTQWQSWQHAGQRYGHTLDPRTGWPVQHAVAAVTVVHAECVHADALSTVLTVLGPDEGLAFANAHGIAALYNLRTSVGTRYMPTSAWSALATATT